LEPWQLPELAMLQVGIGSVAANSFGGNAGTGLGSGGAGSGSGDMAVPIVPELC
jgi:hypothetical protein